MGVARENAQVSCSVSRFVLLVLSVLCRQSRCSLLCCVLEGSGFVLLCAMDLTCACVSLSLSHMEHEWIPSPSRAHLWSLCSYEEHGVRASGRCLSIICVFTLVPSIRSLAPLARVTELRGVAVCVNTNILFY